MSSTACVFPTEHQPHTQAVKPQQTIHNYVGGKLENGSLLIQKTIPLI
ncbi:hypothetical protein ACU8DI_14995 [Psychroserpens sp. BH13MA-6]